MLQLIPLRDGRPLINNNSSSSSSNNDNPFPYPNNKSGVINIKSKKNRTSTVLGRVELLSCLYAACGCDPINHIYTTKRKCIECSQINRWAINSLSRRMIKFKIINNNNNNNNIISLSIRGRHALVVVVVPSSTTTTTASCCCIDDNFNDNNDNDNYCDDEIQNISTTKTTTTTNNDNDNDNDNDNNNDNDNDWRWDFVLNHGMRISLRELEGGGRLDFLVVLRSVNSTRSSTPSNEENNDNEYDDDDDNDCGGSSSNNSNNIVVAGEQQCRDDDRKILLNNNSNNNEYDDDCGGGGETTKTIIKGSGSSSSSSSSSRMCIYFCSIGQDMSRQRIQLLSKDAVVANKGASVVSNYKEATHIIISTLIKSIETVAEYLGETKEDFEEYLRLSNVQCVVPHWLTKSSSSSSSSSLTTGASSSPKTQFVERVHFSFLWPGIYALNKKRKAVVDDSDQMMGITKRKKQLLVVAKTMMPRKNNIEISDAFLKISKLYQNAPLWPEDIWKAYKFNKLAGRLQHLEFDYRDDPSTFISSIRNVPGFGGPSVVGLIRQFISNNGHIKRIDNLRNDPTRIALQNLMAIWGVGRSTALDWVQDGYQDIVQVRDGIMQGKLVVTRNQRVGVDCYEDLLEKMDRDEVKSIGDIIIQAIKSMPAYSSTAEATIMGSYRRGKQSSGDVDVLITFSDHTDSVPNGALQKLVDDLFDRGHIANHLTILPGMTTGGACGGKKYNRKSKSSKEAMSYMGVFYSTKAHRKRRRVDIKMYPLKQKAFATLYFTGSAYFNRSMRQYATERFGYKLSDRGLIDASGKSVMGREGVSITEQFIFQKLQLVYKEPKSRVFFDDVIPL